MKKIKTVFKLLHHSGIAFSNDNAFKLSASLSYYTTFALGPLLREEAHHRLRDGEADGLGRGHRLPPRGSRGSKGSSGQDSRTQAWAGSSQMRQARSGPGPAMTLR